MTRRNEHLAKLPAGYLFPEIDRRRRVLQEQNPQAKILSLGIGNTTQPLTPHIVDALQRAALALGTEAGYSGYGKGEGMIELRRRIAERWYGGIVDAEEVFISDGAKCDCGRVQALFGGQSRIAVQDSVYPVYVDGSVIVGAAGACRDGRFDGIAYLACNPENDFFPNLKTSPRADLIYFCSPNNPTGAAATPPSTGRLDRFRQGESFHRDLRFRLQRVHPGSQSASLHLRDRRLEKRGDGNWLLLQDDRFYRRAIGLERRATRVDLRRRSPGDRGLAANRNHDL